MKTARVVFNTSRVVLGLGHLAFQSLADGCMNAEALVVDKTGYWEDGKQYKLTPYQVSQYKAQRKVATKRTQKEVSAKMLKARAAFDKQFKTVKA